MLHPVRTLARKTCLGVCLTGLLASCGGGTNGFPPVVTGFQVKTLKYGNVAVMYAGGNDLRSSMKVETGSACTSPTIGTDSSTSLLVINCNASSVGEFTVTLKNANGDVIYQTTATVPKPQVQLTTSAGNIVLELNPEAAQNTVNNFLSHVNSGFYTNTLFHRVMPGFVVQGGGFTSGMVKKAGQGNAIALQSNNGLSNTRGTVAMARLSDPNYDSATTEFYINLVDNKFLDYKSATQPGYAVFGTVLQGMDVADTIATRTTGSVGNYSNVPLTDVTITAAQQIK